MIAKKHREIFSIILIILFIIYVVYIVINNQINENYLDKSHIYITVSISKINFGRASTVHYNFKFSNQQKSDRDMCTSEELRKMNVGDIYLARYNQQIEYVKLICDCKLSKSDEGKVWEKFPGCKN